MTDDDETDATRAIEFLIDVPFQLQYDETSGMTVLKAHHATSDNSRMDIHLHFPPTALLALAQNVQRIEEQSDTPPSAHATPRTKQ